MCLSGREGKWKAIQFLSNKSTILVSKSAILPNGLSKIMLLEAIGVEAAPRELFGK